jgi:hypothetical protein
MYFSAQSLVRPWVYENASTGEATLAMSTSMS